MEKAGFDAVIDYKSENVSEQIAHHAPTNGIYFSTMWAAIFWKRPSTINLYGRVVLYGSISTYNAKQPEPGPNNLMALVTNQAHAGFVFSIFCPRHGGDRTAYGWVASGDIVYEVDIAEGFENIPATLQRLYGTEFRQAIIETRRPGIAGPKA